MKFLITSLLFVVLSLSMTEVYAENNQLETESDIAVGAGNNDVSNFGMQIGLTSYSLDDSCRVYNALLKSDPQYRRLVERQNNLHGWSKFCRIYGRISVISGMVLACLGGRAEMKQGTISSLLTVAEGTAALIVGSKLYDSCMETRREITRYNNQVFVPTTSFQVGESSIQPSFQLLSDGDTHAKAFGVGVNITF